MNSTGKQGRRETARNHAGVHRIRHTHKSAAKIRRAGWTRTPTAKRQHSAA